MSKEIKFKENQSDPPGGLPSGAVLAELDSEEDVLLYGEASGFYADALEGQTTIE